MFPETMSRSTGNPIPPLLEQSFLPLFFTLPILFTTLLRPGPFRTISSICLLAALWYHFLTRGWTAGPDFLFSPLFASAITIRWLVIISTGKPEEMFRRVQAGTSSSSRDGSRKQDAVQEGKCDGRGKDVTDRSARFLEKLKWSAELWSNWRGIGWNFGPGPGTSQHPRGQAKETRTPSPRANKKSHTPPSYFITKSIIYAILSTIAQKLLVTHAWCTRAPPFGEDFLSVPLSTQQGLALLQLLLSSMLMENMYRVVSIAAVSLRISAPEAWPPLFGHLALCHSSLTRASEILASALGITNRESLPSRYIRLFAGFLTSGIMHGMAAHFVPSPLGYDKWMMLQMLVFPVIITVEDLGKYLGSRSLPAGLTNGVIALGIGYLWTMFMVSSVHRFVVAYYQDVGMFKDMCPA
ncbi:hypothetical protein MKZ38_005496 [Zalerion maritima]|uniref:Wax synthase domain-containing protein n=1 Tax=Zalerion maritima TaxID=339359 RepID=A0AAD5RW01_9PEZI|nr:hypothetical protein MKZ38_005496 [Zalerion maritima]